jgi:hypothetical protein
LPSQIGRYEIRKELGRGMMGYVRLADVLFFRSMLETPARVTPTTLESPSPRSDPSLIPVALATPDAFSPPPPILGIPLPAPAPKEIPWPGILSLELRKGVVAESLARGRLSLAWK